MTYDPRLHHRRSIRLRDYDYAQVGMYYVTLCVQDRRSLFGTVMDGAMQLNRAGEIAGESWEWLAAQYDHVELDQWVIMPNHFHGILVLTDQVDTRIRCADDARRGGSRTSDQADADITCRGGSRTAPTDVKRKPLGRLIGAFKTVSTKRINEWRGTPGAVVWQRNYYEHIIRDDNALMRVREYINDNPAKWASDTNNPEATATKEDDPWRG